MLEVKQLLIREVNVIEDMYDAVKYIAERYNQRVQEIDSIDNLAEFIDYRKTRNHLYKALKLMKRNVEALSNH
jgi:hypothetical protein